MNLSRRTVCVTGAGGRAWILLGSWKKLEARKMSVNRADSHLSGARFVRPHGWRKKPTDEKKAFGAEALNLAGKTPPPKHLPIL